MTVRGDRARYIPLLLIIATLVAMGRVTRCRFTQWDDPQTVACNPRFNAPAHPSGGRLAIVAHVARGVGYYWRHSDRGLYVPATYTVWGMVACVAQGGLPNSEICQSELKASVFHTVNLLLHVLAVLTVYAILLLLMRHPWAACGGALLFGLHPVQVEAVAWVSGLKDVLSGLLCLVAIWQYLKYALEAPAMLRAEDRWWAVPGRLSSYHWAWHFFAATIAFAAAMLAKPSAVTLPLIVLTLDLLMLRRPARRAIPPMLLWLCLAVPIIIEARHAQAVWMLAPTPVLLRPVIASYSIAFYLYKLIIPMGLAVDYGQRPALILAHWWGYVALLVPIVFTALVWRLRRKRPWLLAAAIIFTCALLPVLGFATFEFQYLSTVADHYLYLAMLGPALALASILTRHRETPMAVACGILFGAFMMRCSTQASYWHDDLTLNQHTIAVNADSVSAHVNLGHDLETHGHFAEALDEYRAAVACDPSYGLARSNAAVMAAALGRLDEAQTQARQLILIASTLPPARQRDFAETYASVAQQLVYKHMPRRALPFVREALRVDPHNASALDVLKQIQSLPHRFQQQP
jgi:hypothetical protein